MTLPDKTLFQKTISYLATGASVVTAKGVDGEHDATTSTLTSVSLEPLLLLICLHRKSAIYRAIAEAGTFGLSILGDDHKNVALLFTSLMLINSIQK